MDHGILQDVWERALNLNPDHDMTNGANQTSNILEVVPSTTTACHVSLHKAQLPVAIFV